MRARPLTRARHLILWALLPFLSANDNPRLYHHQRKVPTQEFLRAQGSVLGGEPIIPGKALLREAVWGGGRSILYEEARMQSVQREKNSNSRVRRAADLRGGGGLTVRDLSAWRVYRDAEAEAEDEKRGKLVAACLHDGLAVVGTVGGRGQGGVTPLADVLDVAFANGEEGEGKGLGIGKAPILLLLLQDSEIREDVAKECKARGLVIEECEASWTKSGDAAGGKRERILAVSKKEMPHAFVSSSVDTLPTNMAGSSVLLTQDSVVRGDNLENHMCISVCTRGRMAAVVVCTANTPDKADSWVEKYVVEPKSKVLGVDMEWRPCFVKGSSTKVALVQVSSGDHVLLAQIHRMSPKGVPPLLAKVLADETIRKVGVGLCNDATKMLRDWGCDCIGRVDLAEFAKQCGRGGMGRSLAALTQSLLGLRLSKAPKIRMGNWEVKTLSYKQTVYAALDAWVAAASLEVLESMHGSHARSITSPSKKPLSCTQHSSFYAVAIGHAPGVYTDMAYAATQIYGVDDAKMRVFKRYEDAVNYVRRNAETSAGNGTEVPAASGAKAVDLNNVRSTSSRKEGKSPSSQGKSPSGASSQRGKSPSAQGRTPSGHVRGGSPLRRGCSPPPRGRSPSSRGGGSGAGSHGRAAGSVHVSKKKTTDKVRGKSVKHRDVREDGAVKAVKTSNQTDTEAKQDGVKARVRAVKISNNATSKSGPPAPTKTTRPPSPPAVRRREPLSSAPEEDSSQGLIVR